MKVISTTKMRKNLSEVIDDVRCKNYPVAIGRRNRIEAIIIKYPDDVAPNLSDGYFESRPKGSQLGALASNQSEVVESRDVLENKLKALELAYKDKEVERPEFWGGYIVKPISIEFWQGRPNRLHGRML